MTTPMGPQKIANEFKGFSASIRREVKNLLEMFEFFLSERQLEKPIDLLGESVRDLRIIIGRLLVDHFLNLSTEDEERFTEALAELLVDRAERIPTENEADVEYFEYVVGEVLMAFEYAQEIKAAYAEDPIQQKIMALDIPVLRPFDYGLQKKLKLIKKARPHKKHPS